MTQISELNTFEKNMAVAEAAIAYHKDKYLDWKRCNNIRSLIDFHQWFLDKDNRKTLDDSIEAEELYLDFYLEDMPVTRGSVNKMTEVLKIWDPYDIYDTLLNYWKGFRDLLSPDEIELYTDLRYRAWKRDFHISSMKDFHEWFNREFYIGELVTYLNAESNESFGFLERFVKELSCNRETAEDLMKYAYDIDADVIYDALAGRYRPFHTEEEQDTYIREA